MHHKDPHTAPPGARCCARGQEVDIYYRADRTVLRGRPEIWARGSYNRYQHPECWMPIKLIPSTGGVLKTSEKIKVPTTPLPF